MAARFISSFNALQNDGQPSNRPVIEVDTEGLRLSADDEQKVYDFFGWIEGKAAAAQAKRDQQALEAQRGPFNFLGLPPELRGITYQYTAANTNAEQATNDGVNFSDHTIPPITLASGLSHQEAISKFYGETPFFINIEANLIDRRNRRLYGALIASVSPSRQARSGTLRMKAPLKTIIRGLGNAVLVRDITFKIFDSEYGRVHRRNAPDSEIVATIRFETRSRTGGGHWLLASVLNGEWHPNNLVRFPSPVNFPSFWDVQDSNVVTHNVVQAAMDIARQPEFHGLTIDNLSTIAREFRST